MKVFVNYQEGASTLEQTLVRDSEALSKKLNYNLLEKYNNNQLATITSGDLPPEKPNVNVNWFAYHTVDRNPEIQINHKLDKPFKYLFLNALPRDNRVLLLKELNARMLLGESIWTDLMGALNGYPKRLDSRYEKPIEDILDHLALCHNSAEINVDLYHDTYFSLITETVHWDQPYSMLTEKFYKPILACHPFIVAANPGVYDYIHSLGFKTFEPWIDESFDKETNLNVRMHMICNEVDKLCRSDLKQFMRATWPIVEHNANRLIEIWKSWQTDTVGKIMQFHVDHNINPSSDQIVITDRYSKETLKRQESAKKP